jgi:hypothetical protein
MRQFLSTAPAAVLFLLLNSALMAQIPTPFWSENFTDGLPANWTTDDASGQGAVWTWCPNPLLGDGDPGCSEIWNTPANGQVPFRATTATTGSMVCDSDDYGELSQNHVSQLTTAPINCTGKSEVFITFQTHIGVFAVDAEANAILRVSNNGTTWTSYTVFPGLTTSERWSDNPETPIINISAVAANQGNVLVQWQWTGNYEYMWSVDDIELYDADPTPKNDVAISAFYFPAQSQVTPASQLPGNIFDFEVNLDNPGTNPQTNITITAYVKDEGGNTVHSQQIVVPELAPGVADSGFVFPQTFTPNLAPGLYSVGYSVTSDSADQRPLNNEFSTPLIVTNQLFAKETQPEQGYRPSAGGDWAVANYYQMDAGNFDEYKAYLAEFTFSTDETEILPNEVAATIYLLKVNDDVAEDFSDFDDSALISSSVEIVGITTYEAPDDMVDQKLQQVDINDFNTAEPGVIMETGGRYLLTVEYLDNNANVFHAFNNDAFYYFPSTFIFNSTWNSAGFGGDINAVLRMYIGLTSTTDEKALPANAFVIAPNPVGQTLRLQLDFEKPTDATITIADLNGRVIHFEDRFDLRNETLQYPLPQLAAGTYLARIATAEGTLTKKFIKQ